MKEDMLTVLAVLLAWILIGGVSAFLELGLEPRLQRRRKWWWQK